MLKIYVNFLEGVGVFEAGVFGRGAFWGKPIWETVFFGTKKGSWIG